MTGSASFAFEHAFEASQALPDGRRRLHLLATKLARPIHDTYSLLQGFYVPRKGAPLVAGLPAGSQARRDLEARKLAYTY